MATRLYGTCQGWVSHAIRAWRDAVRAGIDDAPFLSTVILRKIACERARDADRQRTSNARRAWARKVGSNYRPRGERKTTR